MILPVIKDISSTDWDGVSEVSDEKFCLWFHVEIGQSGTSAADLFQIGACNSAWAESNVSGEHFKVFSENVHFVLKHIILVERLDVQIIVDKIGILIEMKGPYGSWRDFAERMSDYLIWEYEGMEPH